MLSTYKLTYSKDKDVSPAKLHHHSVPKHGASARMGTRLALAQVANSSIPQVEDKQNLVIMGRKRWFNTPEKNQSLKDRINIILNRELKEPPRELIFLPKVWMML